MKHTFFTSLLGAFLIANLSSCCTFHSLNAVAFGGAGVASVSGESYENAGREAMFWAGGFFDLCLNEPDISNTSFGNNSIESSCECYIDKNGRMQKAGWYFTPGIVYSRRGGKYKEDNGLEGKIVSSYIDVPLLIKYKLANGFYAEAGVQPGFLLSARDKYNNNNDDFTSHFKKIDIGIPIGLGYQFTNGIGVGIRVVPGVMNIDKEKNDPTDAANRNFHAGALLSYSFPISKKKKD